MSFNDKTNWQYIIDHSNFRMLSETDFRMVIKELSFKSLGCMYFNSISIIMSSRLHEHTDYVKNAWDFDIEYLEIMYNELKLKLENGERFSKIGHSIENKKALLKLHKQIIAYLSREQSELTDAIVGNYSLRGVHQLYYDRNIIVDQFNSISRSSGFMSRRTVLVRELVIKGLLTSEDASEMPSKISKSYKEGLFESGCKALLESKKIINMGQYDNCIMNEQDFKAFRRNLLNFTIGCMVRKYGSYYYTQFTKTLIKSDVPIAMPLISLSNLYDGSRSYIMQEMKKLLV